MSVQAGIWNLDGRPVTKEDLEKISHNLSEYGPDGEAMHIDGPFGMLYRPLHTTTESRLEQQPFCSASGIIVTWDGRLDNRDELIPQLRDNSNCSPFLTDLALATAAFEHWGKECFARLTGDWAVSIWDPRQRELIIARDHIGVRHLFYYPRPTSLRWCSHLAPLVLSGDKFTLCEEHFASYIALTPDPHLTPYREIYAVPPGSVVSVRNGFIARQTYWAFTPRTKIFYQKDADYESHFRHLFLEAVRDRLRTDSRVLADLSGGLDSTSIVVMADHVLQEDGTGRPAVDTFSSHLRDEPEEEDSLYFPLVEKRRGRIGYHAEIEGLGDTSSFEYAGFVASPGLWGRPEERSVRSNTVKRGGYRVLLSGFGGDEMTGQALDPQVQIADLLWQCHLQMFTKQVLAWSLLLRRPAIHLLLNAFLLGLPAGIRARSADISRVEPWVNKVFARRQKLAFRQLDAAGSWLWRPSDRDWCRTLMALAGAVSGEWPHPSETRYPYLDHRLVEFLISIPTEQLLRPGDRRSLVRRALCDLLPPEIVARRTKSRITRYFSAVLEKRWSELESIIRSSVVSKLGYVNRDDFCAALSDVKNGKLPHYPRVFKALSWELWVREAARQNVILFQRDAQVPHGWLTSQDHPALPVAGVQVGMRNNSERTEIPLI
jgi:asparagine synthase (glutamine-hydrolysing)